MSDIVFLVPDGGTWSVVLVGRYTDVLHRDGDDWRFHHRRLRFTDAG